MLTNIHLKRLQSCCLTKQFFTKFCETSINSQLMRFAESEPESILWPDLTISDNVATKRRWNLWRRNNGLCQQDSEPTETEVPERHGWKRDHKVSDQGGPSCKRSSWHFSQGEQHYDAYKKDIAIVNIFFGEPTVYGEMNRLSPLNILFRVWEISEDDFAGLHLWLWRILWTLPWDQLCLCRWDLLLVHHQDLQEIFLGVNF